jgi:imidazole glycerol-phosphate synthase subunit HisH
MISIVNYGLGNVQAIANIYHRLNIPARVVTTPQELASAERVILPGVGAFDWAMERLERSGMRGVLDELALERRKPVLGICVGMQMMAKRSEEGARDGLGWIDALVRKFDVSAGGRDAHLPHMGWNDVEPRNHDNLFRSFAPGARFYFLHSYYFAPSSDEVVLGTTNYNGVFASCAHAGNIYGVQFHPEKSHHWGIQLLKNFSEF